MDQILEDGDLLGCAILGRDEGIARNIACAAVTDANRVWRAGERLLGWNWIGRDQSRSGDLNRQHCWSHPGSNDHLTSYMLAASPSTPTASSVLLLAFSPSRRP